MGRRSFCGPIGLFLVVALAADAGQAQLSVETLNGFNIFESGSWIIKKYAVCGDMSHGGDLFIEHDLELGGELYLSGLLYLEGREGQGADGDQYIYFYDEDERTDEYLAWKDDDDTFELSNSLAVLGVGGQARIESRDEEKLVVASESSFMWFLTDSVNSIEGATFTWAEDRVSSHERLMELRWENGGDLKIGGTLIPGAFDLAESFWRVGDMAPGDLVAADSKRPDAVRVSRGAYDRRVVGVVSARPGVNLGGGVFSVEALRERWGDEVGEEYERTRPSVEEAVYAANQGLQDELMWLHSQTSYEQYLLSRAAGSVRPSPAAIRRDDGGAPPPSASRPSPKKLAELYEEALADHRRRVEDLVLRRFFRERFVAVALAGRVPVKASAASGAIAIGDPLAASPLPGVAMKATAPGPVIGTALEPLAQGLGTIQVLVNRGWYAGEEDPRLTGAGTGGRGRDVRLADLQAENDQLSSRLAVLEALVAAMMDAGSQPSVSAERGTGSEGIEPAGRLARLGNTHQTTDSP